MREKKSRVFRFHYQIPGQKPTSKDIRAATAQEARERFLAMVKGVLGWQLEDMGEAQEKKA